MAEGGEKCGEAGGDLYSVLGLKKECSDADLKLAYRKLAMRWHPDKCSSSSSAKHMEEAKEKFQEIQGAYSVLSDSNKRFLYDVGVYDDDDNDDSLQGMGDFIGEMAQMMSQSRPTRQESFEELQQLFVDMFQADLDSGFCNGPSKCYHTDAQSQTRTSSTSPSTSPSPPPPVATEAESPSCNGINKRGSSAMDSGKPPRASEVGVDHCQPGFCFGKSDAKQTGEKMRGGNNASRRRNGRKQKIGRDSCFAFVVVTMSGLMNSNLNNSVSNLQDSTGRPFTGSFSGQSGSVPGGFHHSGLHNIHGNFNLPNMPGSLAQRNAAMSALPPSGVQQHRGSMSGRFASNNLPVAMSQITHGHSGVSGRGMNVGGGPAFSSILNIGGSIQGLSSNLGASGSRSSVPGMSVSPALGNLGPRITGSVGNIVGGSNIGRNISSGGLSGTTIASRMNLTGDVGSVGLNVQGSSRMMNGIVHQGSPQMLNMMGSSYPTSGGSLSQNQIQGGNNSLGSTGMMHDASDDAPYDIDFPQLTGRPSSASGPQGQCGIDLTTLGLNLNSPDNLYKTFGSPWSNEPAKGEPEFHIPACYSADQPPPLEFIHFQKFETPTLFCIFYSMPRDEAQLYAANELYNRTWFYHKEVRVWLTRIPNVEPLVKTPHYERGSYGCFDPNSWETIRKIPPDSSFNLLSTVERNFSLCQEQDNDNSEVRACRSAERRRQNRSGNA
uniref:J domain-containing protein n=1 Tax=Leersia perrieri TaxID=77586 RepID=A0A0D9VLV4_9ORYZ